MCACALLAIVAAFDSKLCQLIEQAEQRTKANDGLNLIIAANYGGRWDLTQAMRVLAQRVKRGELEVGDVDERSIQSALSFHGLPDPDLFIRTGGESRISNFLLWQLAYTELYFSQLLWPDFSVAALDEAFSWVCVPGAALWAYRRAGGRSKSLLSTRRER